MAFFAGLLLKSAELVLNLFFNLDLSLIFFSLDFNRKTSFSLEDDVDDEELLEVLLELLDDDELLEELDEDDDDECLRRCRFLVLLSLARF